MKEDRATREGAQACPWSRVLPSAPRRLAVAAACSLLASCGGGGGSGDAVTTSSADDGAVQQPRQQAMAETTATWSPFAREGQYVELPDASPRTFRLGDPAYGYVEKTIDQSWMICSPWFFDGRDPAQGVVKTCDMQSPAAALPPGGGSGWNRVATEGELIRFPDSSPRQLRYGIATAGWLYKTSSSQSVDCSNWNFGGDPAPGVVKSCELYGDAAAAPAPSPSPPPAPTPGAWRPFNASSPWNTPIGAAPALHPNSAQLVETFATSSPWGEHLDINIDRWSIPLYWADANTPRVPVQVGLGGFGWMGWPATANMPIPNGAAPDPAGDASMLVVDTARTTEWGCYAMSYDAGRNPAWQAQLCATMDLTGSGVRPPQPTASPWYAAHGARACGFPLVAGLIRVEEVQAGAIEHALVVAYPKLMANRFMSPASTGSAIGTGPSEPGLPCGARIQLDPTLDVTRLGLSPAGVMVARALQKYGAYVGDYSGALTLYAENAPAAQAYWRGGVLDMYTLAGKVDPRRLRVLAYGQVYN